MPRGCAIISDPCAELAAYLTDTGLAYRALSPLDGPFARVRFLGVFQGQAVAWDAEIVALEAYDRQWASRQGADRALTIEPARAGRQFIEIGDPGENGLALRVGLALPRIDAAAVLCTMTMIRNYKRLRTGRHEFGEHGTFTAG